ncbi:hypothetical protein EJ03DRAFT_350732 [Teratosphaeria nubilosa]|uniref:Uncharacterized protein n=1 Tax=Teratosphaeria nubilosa TaxID=161662 RepID=A0A6G1LC61_9PEZI|nr:hypothetical protein EJ03DRAFT_350732 [Teratosphaeria nubilosa]
MGSSEHVHGLVLRLVNFADLEPDEKRLIHLPKTPTNSTATTLTVNGKAFEAIQARSFEVYQLWRTSRETLCLRDWTVLAEVYALSNAFHHEAFADAVIDAAWDFAGAEAEDDDFERFAAEIYWATSGYHEHRYRTLVQEIRQQLDLRVEDFDGLSADNTDARWEESSWACFTNDFKINIRASMNPDPACQFHAHAQAQSCPAALPDLEIARATALLNVGDDDCVPNDSTSPHETH